MVISKTKVKFQTKLQHNLSVLCDVCAIVMATVFAFALSYNIRQHETIIKILNELQREGFSSVGGSVGVDIPLVWLLIAGVIFVLAGGVLRVRRGNSFLTRAAMVAIAMLLVAVIIWGVGLGFGTKNLFQSQVGL